jgi:integrase/recombinase XerD
MVAEPLKELGVISNHYGAHSLRHSCATHLLRSGSTLRDVADFLGHRGLSSVSIYAKYDIRSLREVASFSLGGVL